MQPLRRVLHGHALRARPALGRHFFERAPCPALQAIPDGFECGLVADPAKYSIRTAIHGEDKMREAAALIVGAGDGCDARFNGEWTNREFHARMERQDALNQDKRNAALDLWGVRP